MEKKKIVDYCGECYAILLPVYYECEDKPAWRVVFKGSKEECRDKIDLYPEYTAATYEENLQNRKNKMQEYLFLLSIKKIKDAEKIKKAFNF